MAADQRMKGLNGAADVGLRGKKKKEEEKPAAAIESNGFGVKPRVSLEWDAARKRVVAKREQIGLSWRNLRPFVEPQPGGLKILADSFDIPRELFKLDNVEEFLSYEVWQTCLSERERRFLWQFLPGGTEPQQVVKQLLGGENLHFGNRFLDWAASLQSGSLHPDAVVHQEQFLKSEKSAYYMELHRYHNEMIGSLLKMKETWLSSDEFKKNTMRSKNAVEKKFSRVDESEFLDLDNNFVGTSNSSSFSMEEKTSNSADQIESLKRAGDSLKRITKKTNNKGRGKLPSVASIDASVGTSKRMKIVKVTKRNVVHHDGTEYMSYIKVTKKQHELAKSMEQSGSGIQSGCLGNLQNLLIKPYKVFVEEQQKDLHDHWLNVANHDLPSSYGIWIGIHSQRRQMMKSLEKELLERHDSLLEGDGILRNENARVYDEGIGLTLIMKGGSGSPLSTSHVLQDEKEADYASPMEVNEESTAPSLVNDLRGDGGEMDQQFIEEILDESISCSDTKMAIGSKVDIPGIVLPDEDANPVPGSSQDPCLNQAPCSSSGNRAFNHVGPESELLQATSAAQVMSAYSGNLNASDLIDMDGVPLSQSADMWQPVSSASSMPLTYFHTSSTGCQLNLVSEIPLPSSLSPAGGDQPAPQWMELESNLQEQAPQLLMDSNSFGSYSNHRDQNELLQSIFSSPQGVLHLSSSNNQQKHMASLNFQMPNNVLAETYGHRTQNISTGCILPNGGGNVYPMQQRAPEHHMLPQSISVQEWAYPRQSTMQPPLPGQSWFNEHQIRGGGWASTSAGSIQPSNIVVDQSMYGILPHCNQLSSRPSSYNSVDQFIPSRSYSHGLMTGPGLGSVMPHHPASSLNYMNRRDDDTGWMSLPLQQNSMNNSMGKPPFLGSWNQ